MSSVFQLHFSTTSTHITPQKKTPSGCTGRLLKALIAIGQPVEFYVAIDTWDSNDTRHHLLYVSNTSDSRAEIDGLKFGEKYHGWMSVLKHVCCKCIYIYIWTSNQLNIPLLEIWNMCSHVPIIEEKKHLHSWDHGPFFLWWGVALWFFGDASACFFSNPFSAPRVVPPPSNSGKCRFSSGSPTRNIILVVTIASWAGEQPKVMFIFHRWVSQHVCEILLQRLFLLSCPELWDRPFFLKRLL